MQNKVSIKSYSTTNYRDEHLGHPVIFTSGESAKEKCFQSRVKKGESRSTLNIAI